MSVVELGLDASPSRERLGRVVELLRGVEEDTVRPRPRPRRRSQRTVAVRPMPTSWASEPDEPVA